MFHLTEVHVLSPLLGSATWGASASDCCGPTVDRGAQASVLSPVSSPFGVIVGLLGHVAILFLAFEELPCWFRCGCVVLLPASRVGEPGSALPPCSCVC